MASSEQTIADAAATCFVIGPIGDKFADAGSEERLVWEDSIRVWDEVISPACEAVGLTPIRSDAISQPGEIPEQVFQLLRDSDIVIADLTGGNANVMYELGMRHTTGRCTVSLAERARIPFDVSVIRTIVFRRTDTGFLDARDDLKASLEECLRGNHRPVSAGRIWAASSDESAHDPPSVRPEGDPGEPADVEESEGFLERLARMEEDLPHAVEVLNRLNDVVNDLGDLMTSATAEISAAEAKGGNVAARRLSIAARIGKELDERADLLEEVATEYEHDIAGIDAGLSAFLEAIELDPSRLEELGDLPAVISSTAEVVGEAMRSGDEMADIVAGLAPLARPLRGPSQRVAAAVRRVTKASAAFQVWSSRFGKARSLAVSEAPKDAS